MGTPSSPVGVHRQGVDAKACRHWLTSIGRENVCKTQEHPVEISAVFGHSEVFFGGVHFSH